MDALTKASLLGFGLVMLAQVVALAILHVRSGGGMPGRLACSRESRFHASELDAFLERLRQRLIDLGFRRGANDREFLQEEPPIGEIGAFPHSATRKQMTVQFDEKEDGTVAARLTVQYLEFIFVDTGEAAYAAELLKYVSGSADSMRKVPNQSLTAWNSVVGGVLACMLSGILITSRSGSLWPAVAILGVTEFCLGLAAVAGMWLKRGEIVGWKKAVVGIILSVTAVVTSLTYILNAPAGSGN